MSPRKLTEDDKQEILEQYRNSEATTSTLAQSFEVSSSTISRFLKNKLSTTEYEELIQEKRLARTPRGEKPPEKQQITSPAKTTAKPKSTRNSKLKKLAADPVEAHELASTSELLPDQIEQPPKVSSSRRRRSSSLTSATSEIAKLPEVEVEQLGLSLEPELPTATPTKLVLDKAHNKSTDESSPKSDRLILKRDRPELEDDEDDEMDLLTLREMLGEDLADINDEEDEEDEEDDDELAYSLPVSDFSHISNIQILPLSQASLPRICYLVIDRSAELIVKPLAEFADLGAIPETETSQATLPVFDNHRIAKRFSHRRERVIKVPDGRMLQKTSHHLQDKGITRLLIDGRIYSLSQ